MKDKDFKNSVLNKQIEFVNGTAIKCVLKQNRKIDEIGIIQITSTQVTTVIEIIEGKEIVFTTQGKKYMKEKDDKNKQMKLF